MYTKTITMSMMLSVLVSAAPVALIHDVNVSDAAGNVDAVHKGVNAPVLNNVVKARHYGDVNVEHTVGNIDVLNGGINTAILNNVNG